MSTRAITIKAPAAAIWPWLGGAFDLLIGEPAHLIVEVGVLHGVKQRAARQGPPAERAPAESRTAAGV